MQFQHQLQEAHIHCPQMKNEPSVVASDFKSYHKKKRKPKIGLPPPRLANHLDEEAFGYVMNDDQPSTIFSVFIPPPPEEIMDKH